MRHDRPRRTSLLILFLVLGGIATGLVLASRYYEGCKGAAEGPVRDVSFTVDEGATAEQVVGDLAEARVIPCGGFVGNLLMRGTGKAGDIRAGAKGETRGGGGVAEKIGQQGFAEIHADAGRPVIGGGGDIGAGGLAGHDHEQHLFGAQ